ncbi:aspartyl protease family protein At5g10770 [Sorghum bicolor]|uniref:aspartyl protease family protein At5g10770 n=1 Tax=Sorghum bicolor TaxID=4558 RepID=UPI000B424A19|nr:aspartyl protease family protein At5g10770 [Sorghum bicolor]|eukprot:XP_002442820.2 aspartyl protease family protein At5g10770 [Sorghum bicolor]
MDGGSESRLRKDGAFHFPVFHRKHPCVDDNSSTIIHAASVSDAGTVIGNDKIHQGKYLMAISLGTPAVFNLVAIDTGSTLSWVNCERCLIRCHEQAGPKLDPHRSATYRHVVGCSDEDCLDVQGDNGVPYGCVDDDETDTCLYGLRYGSQYSVGKLGRDREARPGRQLHYTIVDGFVFGCSEDDRFYGLEAGVIGLGDKRYSFFNQMARLTTYNAFAYCFPGDHRAEGVSHRRAVPAEEAGARHHIDQGIRA